MRRALPFVLGLIVGLGAGFVGGDFAGRFGFDPFGLGGVGPAAQGVIDANTKAVDANQRAVDLIDRYLSGSRR